MLRIYPVSVQLVREARPLAEKISQFDRDQARQLRRSISSVALNIAEGCVGRGGVNRVRFESALGSARESLANLEVAAAVGYIDSIGAETRNRFNHVIGTLVKLVR